MIKFFAKFGVVLKCALIKLNKMKPVYLDLMQKRFKPLGYFFDELFAESDRLAFFRIISDNITPLINKSDVYDPLLLKWRNQKNLHRQEGLTFRENLNQLVVKSIEFLFSTVYANDVATKQQELDLLNKLKLNPQILLYPTNAMGRFKILLNNAQEKGGEFYARVERAIDAIKRHDNSFMWDKVDSAWMANEYLNLLRWCWHTQISFFDYKYNYTGSGNKDEKTERLGLYTPYLEEIELIKNKQDSDCICFFKMDLFKRYAKIIIADLILHQETKLVKNTNLSKSQTISPYSLEFFIEDQNLCMNVLWEKNCAVDVYLVHRFNTPSSGHDLKSSGNQKFMDEILKNSPGTKIYIEKSCSLGFTVPKFLDRTNLKGPIAEVLFSKRTVKYLILRANPVIIADIENLSKATLRDLRSQIKQFEKIPNLQSSYF